MAILSPNRCLSSIIYWIQSPEFFSTVLIRLIYNDHNRIKIRSLWAMELRMVFVLDDLYEEVQYFHQVVSSNILSWGYSPADYSWFFMLLDLRQSINWNFVFSLYCSRIQSKEYFQIFFREGYLFDCNTIFRLYRYI